ncbi:bifunctional 2-polyprenyl-6-hydroxyphenol methylase/3-demethylubiquinol 3-O-methyltransferase UbiG [Geothrix sp. 21YS21S-2]|uniref:class I SAM-dependent methyltransferase n=1 Tax=Geothrix sp. 21YS21S-2 TaxID=3068893 RepID=UPI0027B9244F|nr:class I SAM-dependent methyltransferase [Geothrix sp. 21YS21S-2]
MVRCRACGGASLDPLPEPAAQAELYQEDYYQEDSGGRFLGLAEALVVGLKSSRYRAVAARCGGGNSILDVGCGRGDLLALFKAKGWTVKGTQVSRTAAEAARRLRNIDVAVGELPDLGLEPASFNVITFFHVLEHLANPRAYLACARDLLADGGLLVVEVPNFRTWGFRLLGRRNLCFDYPHHLHFLTPAALAGLVEHCGFRVEERTWYSLEYSAFTTLQNWLNLLPGEPSRLYRALMGNPAGISLRRSPWTWLHLLLGTLLGPLAFLVSAMSLALPMGNTIRFYCRKVPGARAFPFRP